MTHRAHHRTGGCALTSRWEDPVQLSCGHTYGFTPAGYGVLAWAMRGARPVWRPDRRRGEEASREKLLGKHRAAHVGRTLPSHKLHAFPRLRLSGASGVRRATLATALGMLGRPVRLRAGRAVSGRQRRRQRVSPAVSGDLVFGLAGGVSVYVAHRCGV